MDKKIILRSFEDRDIDFIQRTKQRIGGTVGSIGLEYGEVQAWMERVALSADRFYWAICSNDEFQNIVGWCCLKVNGEQSLFCGATISSNRYNNVDVYYDTYSEVLRRAFEEIRVSEVRCVSMSDIPFHKTLNDIFFSKGRDERVLTLEQYEKLQFDGVAAKKSFMSDLTAALDRNTEDGGIDNFLSLVKANLEYTNPKTIHAMTEFRELEEWNSLYAIEFVSIVESRYKARLEGEDVSECRTLLDLYKVIEVKSLETRLSNIEPIECDIFES